jgi:antitoxin MazE
MCIAAVMKAAWLAIDDVVDVREDSGRVIIEPVRDINYDLDELLAGISAKNIHDKVEFGAPVGKGAA